MFAVDEKYDRSVEQEFLVVCLPVDELAHHVGGDEETANDQEQECIVELFIDHVELLVGHDSGEEEIVAVGEHLRGRLEPGGESCNLVEASESEIVAEVALVICRHHGLVWQVLGVLELNIHGLLL